jgi:ribosomal protein S18 acetylase RimI-like enzyme
MKCTVGFTIDPDELHELIRLNRKQFAGKFIFEKNDIAEEGLESISIDFAKLLGKPQITKLVLTKGNQTIGVAAVDESRWDSEIFDLKYGKMKLLCFHPETNQDEKIHLLENLVKKLSEEGFRLVIARIPMDDISTINALEREGAIVTDVLVTYQRDTKNLTPLHVILDGVRITEANSNDEGEVTKIAQSVFKIDHFHSDQQLPGNRSDELYAKWATNSFHGLADVILVAKKGTDMVGFITCKTENLTPKYKYGAIDLVGVTYESRGKGVGRALVAGALKWFSKRVPTVYVGTQSGNISALRLYESSGFRATSAEATLHLWIPQERRSRKS